MKKVLTLALVIFGLQIRLYASCSSPLPNKMFETELIKIKAHDFDEAKKIAIEILLEKCLTSIQVKELLKELNFEEDKLDIAKKAFSKISDPENYGVIKTVFDFEESKKVIDGLSK